MKSWASTARARITPITSTGIRRAPALKLLANPRLYALILRGREGRSGDHIFHENKAGNGLNTAITGRVVVLVNVAFQPVYIGEGLL